LKALLWHGAKDIRIEDVNEPEIAPGMVIIEVAWCGICGSDLHEYLKGPITIPVSNPHPLTGQVAPVIMGHEFSGKVVEIGDGVTNVAVGDRVVVDPILYCGTCASCKKGYHNLCVKLGFHGITANGGGFSEYTMVPFHMVHKLPSQISLEEGALVEPASVAIHAVRQSSLKLGDTCAVFGAGPIGLLVIQAAKAAGANNIIAVEVSESRLQKAAEVGATHFINPKKENTLAMIRQITGNNGVDVSFEVSGVESALLEAVQSAKAGGETVIVSLWENSVSFHPNLLVLSERKLLSSAAFRHIMPETISLIASGKMNVKPIITKQITLDQIVEEGFETLAHDKSHAKIIVTPRN